MATQDGIDALKRLAVQFRGILDLADALERINSVEQSEAEARARMDGLGKQIAKKEGELNDALAAIEKARGEADEIAVQTQAMTQAINAKAETEAKKAIEAGNREAEKIIAEAKAEASRITSSANASADKARAEAQAAKNEAADALARRDTSLASLKVAEDKLAAAKEQISRLLKG
jgi:hypothetical protein